MQPPARAGRAGGWRRWLPGGVFLLTALYLALPMLRPGHVLLLDHALRLRGNQQLDLWGRSGTVDADLPLDFLIAAGVWVLGSELFDRAWFIGMMTAAGLGGYTLAGGTRERYRYLAGLLVMVNPWVHDRVVAGQWTVVLAYASAPWLLIAWLGWARTLQWRAVAGAALLAALAVVLSLSMGLIAVLGAGLATLPWALTHARQGGGGRVVLQYGAIAGGLLLTQLHWMAALGGTQRLESIGAADLAAFATLPDATFGLVGNVLALYGFWREPEGVPGAELAKWGLPRWWLFAFAILAAAGGGAWSLMRSQDREARRTAIGLALMAAFAFVFALGAQGPTGPLFAWAYEHVPGFNGFREPQKAVGLLAIAYAVLGAHGLSALHEWYARARSGTSWELRALAMIGAAVVLIASHRQVDVRTSALQPVSFPAAWYAARALIEEEEGAGYTLVLPWHQYFAPSFGNGRVMTNPAAVFFRPPLITADNLELPGLYTESANPVSALIEAVLAQREQVREFAEIAGVLGVQYVVWLQEADTAAYGFLDQQPGLERIATWPEVTVYRNTAFHGRLYAVEEVVPPLSAEELVRSGAARLDLARVAPVEGAPDPKHGDGQVRAHELAAWGARGEVDRAAWVVLAEPFDERLRVRQEGVDGGGARLAYSAVNAVYVPEAGQFSVRPAGLARLWALRTVSAVTAAVLVGAMVVASRRGSEGITKR